MKAVTKFFWMSSVTSSRARLPEYVTDEVLDGEHRLGAAAVGCGGKLAELAGVDARRRHAHEPAGSVVRGRFGVGCRVVNDW